MLKESPVLSIVIPTKNRYSTLKVVLKSFSSLMDKNIEIVVQDNSNNNEIILNFLNDLSDKRIKYFYNSKSLTAPENCDLAISNAKGKYVCFIGDDDGLAENIIDLCFWMDNNEIDSATLNFAIYNWPDLEDKNYGFKFAGEFKILKHKKEIVKINPLNELKKLLEKGALEITKTPRVYHGIVKKSKLDELFLKTNTYFPGPVPDMSNSVALAGMISKHVFVDYPIVIAGAAGHSMAGKGALKKHHGLLELESSLPKETVDNWSSELPKYWSSQTIWAEGALKALDAIGLSEYKKLLNLDFNLAACLMYVPDFRKLTFKKILELKAGNRVQIFKIFKYFMIITFKRISTYLNTYNKRLFNFDKDSVLLTRSIDVGEAMNTLNIFNKKSPISFPTNI